LRYRVDQARTANKVLLEAILNTETKSQTASMQSQDHKHPSLEKLLSEDPKLCDLFRGSWSKYGYKSRSEAEQAVITKLVLRGFSDDEINTAMEKCGIGKWLEKPDSYRTLSIENARKHAKTNNFSSSNSAHYEPESEAETKEKRKEKPKLHKACGLAEQGYYESIYHKEKPAFLVANDGNFRVCEEVTAENETFLPKEYPTSSPTNHTATTKTLAQQGRVVLEDPRRIRPVSGPGADLEGLPCSLRPAQLPAGKTRTIPYVYFVGDNESGKTVALSLLNWLCYRPMLGVTIPSADTYGYLDDAEAPGVILEDEAQGLYKDLDKAKIYKAGYKQGAVVPRTMITQSKRFIKYFRVFCFKACAAEEIPRVKGLLERFIFIAMTEGYPRKDWADFDEADEKRLRELRNMLLKWRMASMEWKIPEIDLPVKGRLKELWKPIIQIVSGLTVEQDLRAHLDQLQKERLNEKINTLEGHIVKVVCELYAPNEPLAFATSGTP
jgi:hypothetical protein